MTNSTRTTRPIPGNARDRGETTTVHDQSAPSVQRGGGPGPAKPVVEPQLPHEIDESSHSQADGLPEQAAVGAQAHRDATGPAQDTDRGPVLDEVYNRTLAPDRGESPPRK